MTSFLEQEANHFHPPLNLILQPLLAVITNVKILPKGQPSELPIPMNRSNKYKVFISKLRLLATN